MRILKHIREKAGMTQQQMADYLKLSESHYSMIECKQRELKLPQLQKVTLLYAQLEAEECIPYHELVDESKDLNKLKSELRKTKLREENIRRQLATMMQRQKNNLTRKRQLLQQKLKANNTIQKTVFTSKDEIKLNRSLCKNGCAEQIVLQVNLETACFRRQILEGIIRCWETECDSY